MNIQYLLQAKLLNKFVKRKYSLHVFHTKLRAGYFQYVTYSGGQDRGVSQKSGMIYQQNIKSKS